jgi:hypothetical protein
MTLLRALAGGNGYSLRTTLEDSVLALTLIVRGDLTSEQAELFKLRYGKEGE